MVDSGEVLRISEVQRSAEDDRLLSLTDEFEKDGWETTLENIKNIILDSPGWLLDPSVFEEYQIDHIRKVLSSLRDNKLKSLDGSFSYFEDTPSHFAFVMRFLEVFSEKYNYPYVWRGGSLSDVDNSVGGTFTFFVGVAKDFVMRSYLGPRKDPCLIGLPVTAIIDQYKKSGKISGFIAEHGYDGIFNASFDIYIHDEVPEGTMIYLPD